MPKERIRTSIPQRRRAAVVRALNRLYSYREEQRLVWMEAKDNVATASAQIRSLEGEIKRRTHTIECFWKMNTPKKGLKSCFISETGALVKMVKMTKEDRKAK